MFHCRIFRVLLAYVQVTLMIGIIISGLLFVHKHKTQTGEIVVHNHPYNLKEDPDKIPHHETDDEIHFLDVIFSGSFVVYGSLSIDFPFLAGIPKAYSALVTEKLHQLEISHYYLRGPPTLV